MSQGHPPHQGQYQQPQYPQQQNQQQQQQQQYQQQQYQQQQPAGGGMQVPGMDPKGQQLMAEIKMLPGEQAIYSIAADGYFISSHPIAKAFAKLQAFMVTITGGHIRIYLVVTNQRVLLVESRQMWCGATRVRAVNSIALASLAEAGSAKETMWCCIHTRLIHIESKTQRYNMIAKKIDDNALREFVANLSAVMISNVQARTST